MFYIAVCGITGDDMVDRSIAIARVSLMANTTEFYTYPKRTLYHLGDTPDAMIDKKLIPSTAPDPLSFPSNAIRDIFVDFGEEVELSHFYVDVENVSDMEVFYLTDRDGTADNYEIGVAKLDGEASVYKLIEHDNRWSGKGRWFRFVATVKDSAMDVSWNSLLLFNQILSFKDGAFNQIAFKPTHPTRGHHKMMVGGKRPYQGLGIMKRKMTMGATEVPYVYREHIVPDYLTIPDPLPPDYDGLKKEDFPGDRPYYELADLKRINQMFQYHLEFVFADSLNRYPDRIFPASFEEKELNEPFTNGLKHLGYDVSFTVVEI